MSPDVTAASIEYVLFDGDGRANTLTIQRRYPLPFVADGDHNAEYYVMLGDNALKYAIVLSDRQMQELFMAYAIIKQEYDTGIEVTHDSP